MSSTAERTAPITVHVPAPRSPLPRPVAGRQLPGAVVAAVLSAVMAAVATYGAGGRALWQNEYLAWYAARLPIGDLWRLVGHVDMDKATYFLAMHFWILVAGDNPTALRAPSIAAMAVAAGATALIGRRLFGATAGLVAGLLMAAIPAVSRYAAEASSYAYVMAAVTVSTVLLLRAYDKPTAARWIAYGASITCIGYLHFVALLILIPHWATYRRAVKASPGGNPPDWPAAVYLGLLPVAPLIWMAHGQSNAIAWIHTTGTDLATYPTNLFMSAPVAGAVCFTALAGGALIYKRMRDRGTLTFLALWAAIPPILGAATSPWLHLFLPRYYLFTVPAWALLFAAVATRVLRRTRAHRLVPPAVALALVGLVAALGVPGQRQVRQSPTDGRPDMRSAIAVIAANQQNGDGIAFSGTDSRLYVRQAVAYELRGTSQPRDVFLAEPADRAGSYVATECHEPTRCLGGTSRLWLITSSAGSPTAETSNKAIANLLRRNFTASTVYRFHRVRVELLERRS